MRHNGLDVAMFEILQVLKFSMKRERLEFAADWRPAREDELLTSEPQCLTTPDTALDADAAAARMLGELRFNDILTLLNQSD